MPIQRVVFKIGNMRKEADWIVYPASKDANANDPYLFVQSDKRALSINLTTKKGRLSKSQNYPGFHSVYLPGSIEVDVPDELIEQLTAAQPKKGDTIGNGVCVIG